MFTILGPDALALLFRLKFQRALRRAEPTQHHVLREILVANAESWFGRAHGFGSIRSIYEYQDAVPVCTYKDLVEPIGRIANGEVGILTEEPVNFLQLTSGTTTGEQKLIPCTRTYQHKVWAAILAAQGFFNRSALQHGLQRGRGLMLLTSLPTGTTKGGIPFGPVSVAVAPKAQRYWNWFSLVPYEVTQLADPETRRYMILRFAIMSASLAFVHTPYMTSLLALALTLSRRSTELIKDVAQGSITPQADLTSNQRAIFAQYLLPLPQRAATLERLASSTWGLIPHQVWPEIGWLYTVWGPTFQPYERQLSDLYGHKAGWGVPYIASESLLGIPWSVNSYYHIPAVTATFLEFIPESDWHLSQPRTCLLTQLKSGERYEPVVTSWNGIYRYRLSDVVEVGRAYMGVPTLKVVSRRVGILNIIWEKTTEAQIVAAVEICEAQLHQSIVDFVVDIDRQETLGRYRLWAEFNGMLPELESAQRELDNALRRTNPIYNILRNSGDIAAPVIKPLPAGAFERFRLFRERQGTPPEQIKILHSADNGIYISYFEREANRTHPICRECSEHRQKS